jgi:hypothetical protein
MLACGSLETLGVKMRTRPRGYRPWEEVGAGDEVGGGWRKGGGGTAQRVVFAKEGLRALRPLSFFLS